MMIKFTLTTRPSERIERPIYVYANSRHNFFTVDEAKQVLKNLTELIKEVDST